MHTRSGALASQSVLSFFASFYHFHSSRTFETSKSAGSLEVALGCDPRTRQKPEPLQHATGNSHIEGMLVVVEQVEDERFHLAARGARKQRTVQLKALSGGLDPDNA